MLGLFKNKRKAQETDIVPEIEDDIAPVDYAADTQHVIGGMIESFEKHLKAARDDSERDMPKEQKDIYSKAYAEELSFIGRKYFDLLIEAENPSQQRDLIAKGFRHLSHDYEECREAKLKLLQDLRPCYDRANPPQQKDINPDLAGIAKIIKAHAKAQHTPSSRILHTIGIMMLEDPRNEKTPTHQSNYTNG